MINEDAAGHDPGGGWLRRPLPCTSRSSRAVRACDAKMQTPASLAGASQTRLRADRRNAAADSQAQQPISNLCRATRSGRDRENPRLRVRAGCVLPRRRQFHVPLPLVVVAARQRPTWRSGVAALDPVRTPSVSWCRARPAELAIPCVNRVGSARDGAGAKGLVHDRYGRCDLRREWWPRSEVGRGQA